ncbi:spore coat protein U-like protein [Advenella incenata]|jgi:spore coat protein U-like protein|uniref:Spore coat protein U-like protein n=1 Tax=Advenella incenata TaxID=267800 RepID=A0A4Q7VST2_9BURK|nr:spore coat U domain-containing protein [Advenella incenata]RZT99611.1 spore coat protein U-like protein [Advenella incenata]
MKTKIMVMCVGMAVTLVSMSARAASEATTFDVTISITPSCNISTLGNGVSTLAFGSHDSFQTQVAGSTDLVVTCTNGAAYQLGLNEGLHASTAADVNTRRMIGVSTAPDNTADFVPYQLYQDASYATVWGNTLDTNTKAATGTGTQDTHTVYGRVPSTNYTVGNYQDTITATVTF